jgi:hypothetical protein
MNLVTVLNAFNVAEADLARTRLEAAGFHAVVMGEMGTATTGLYATAGSIRVQVLESEAEEARAFLAADKSASE